jgi:hypothetical protein
VPASEQPLSSASPRKSPSSAGASSSERASLGSSCRSPLPRYIPVSASSPRPKTFGGDSCSPSNSQCRSDPGREPGNVKISSPVMVLGISGSGKKEGTRPDIGSPRKISASPKESLHSRVVTNTPRSVPITMELQAKVSPATSPASNTNNQTHSSLPVRDWNIFEKSYDLVDKAATAASQAQVALATQAPHVGVASISKISVRVKSKESSPDQNHSSVSQNQQSTRGVQPPQKSYRFNQEQRNRQISARRDTNSTTSTERVAVDTMVSSVADLVAIFENAESHHGRTQTDPSSVVVQRSTPGSRSFTGQNDNIQKLSPRSAAAVSASLYSDLRSASEAAVKSGSSASVLQLYPQNAVWNQDSSTVLREFYPDCTVHGVTIPDAASSSPKHKHAAKPPIRTPLKASSADHARTPVVSAPSVSFLPTALDWLHFKRMILYVHACLHYNALCRITYSRLFTLQFAASSTTWKILPCSPPPVHLELRPFCDSHLL